MQKFEILTGIVAPLPIINIDTDMIIPKQFLKTIKRTGLGVHLFDEMRFDSRGKPIADFVLNNAPYDKAQIIVAGDNFGCGSSREHAPWSLLDFGIRTIIAPSFADIFFNNCFKNGILPIVLPKAQVAQITQFAQNSDKPALTIDLPSQTIRSADGSINISFEIEPFRKEKLLNGYDDIALTLQSSDAISAFEQKQQQYAPWLYKSNG